MWRLTTILIALMLAGAGCAGKQDYRIVPAEQRDLLLRDNAVVVEGRVVRSKHTLRPTAGQSTSILFIPMSVSAKNPRYDATVAIDRVLKGEAPSSTIELRNYRPLTAEENAAFVDGYGIHNNSVLRIGFDRRGGGRFTSLTIVPLGNTPEFDEALRQAASVREAHTSTRPATRQGEVPR